MAVCRRSPYGAYFLTIHEVLTERASPILITNRSGIHLTCGYRTQNLNFAGACVAMLSHIEIEANGGGIPFRVDAVLFQEIDRKNCGLSGIPATERNAFAFEIADAVNVRRCTSN